MKYLVYFLLAACMVWAKEPPRKQLGGPPTEFSVMELPSPSSAYQVESSVMYQVPLQSLEAGAAGTTIDLAVDSTQYFQFTLSSPIFADLVLTLTDPTGKQVSLSNGVKEQIPLGDAGSNNVPAVSWSFTNPVTGTWLLNVVTGVPKSKEYIELVTTQDQLIVLLYNHNPTVQLDVSISEFNLLTGNSIGLVAEMDDAAGGAIAEGNVVCELPDGSIVNVPMHDDGLHLDGNAADGIWGGVFTAALAGTYQSQVLVKGTTASGVSFVRSAQVPFSVVDDHTAFTGTALTSQLDATNARTVITLGVSGASLNKYRAYAEVWGTSSGSLVPVAWISSLVNVEAVSGGYAVNLELDNDWISLANALPPFQLQKVSLQDINSGDLVSYATTMPITLDKSTKLALNTRLERVVVNITEEMRWGIRPSHIRRPEEFEASEPPMVLSHGYCADVNPWSLAGTAWSEPHFFLDANANRPNDQFALLLHDFTEEKGIAHRWVGIGHSQGGIALTHLYNYYWTGLDAGSGRRVQSVGTPYQGNSIAGSAASLGNLFGVGCGANTDMTESGAATWIAGISMEARKEVYYYTTTYELGNFFGDSCIMAANAILDWPNDGVTELDKAHLPGANYMGNTEKQCHTTDMNYAAQYLDVTRNNQMNSLSLSSPHSKVQSANSTCTVCRVIGLVAEAAVAAGNVNTTAIITVLDKACDVPFLASLKPICESLINTEAEPLSKCLCQGDEATTCCALIGACPN